MLFLCRDLKFVTFFGVQLGTNPQKDDAQLSCGASTLLRGKQVQVALRLKAVSSNPCTD